jgi:peptide/nickel transport system permease protein
LSIADVTVATGELKAVDNRKVFALRVAVRLVRSLVVAFWVTVIAFTLIRLAPGDPAQSRLGPSAEREAVDALRRQLGLDLHPIQQFINFFAGLVRGDMGLSLQFNREVTDIIFTALPVTLWLIGFSVVISVLVAVPIALFVATSHNPVLAYIFRGSTAVAIALPNFFVALVGILIFSIKFNWAPLLGYTPGFPGNLRYLWLPAVVNAVALVAILSRVLYSSISDTLKEEFVETGVIRGISRPRLLWFYILKPSLAPTVALLSYIMGVMLGTTVIMESIFALPGIGTELISAVLLRDYPLVQGITFIFGIIVVFFSFVGDLLAYWLDRRVKF